MTRLLSLLVLAAALCLNFPAYWLPRLAGVAVRGRSFMLCGIFLFLTPWIFSYTRASSNVVCKCTSWRSLVSCSRKKRHGDEIVVPRGRAARPINQWDLVMCAAGAMRNGLTFSQPATICSVFAGLIYLLRDGEGCGKVFWLLGDRRRIRRAGQRTPCGQSGR